MHEHLKTQRIWLWTGGAIEDHLGLSGKNERIWSQFLRRLDQETFEVVVDDAEGIRGLIDWLSDPAGWSTAASLEAPAGNDSTVAGEV